MPLSHKNLSRVNILFIFGSHRHNGNSEKILEILKESPVYDNLNIKSIFLLDKKILYCKSCYECTSKGECVLEDDVKEVVDEMKAADIIAYVPVVYAFSSSSIFQTFLERSGYGFLRPQNRPLRDKLALVIVIGRRYAHTSVATQVLLNVLLNEMAVVGSGFLPLIFSTGEFPGDINLDTEGIEALKRNLERTIEWHYARKGVNCDEVVID